MGRTRLHPWLIAALLSLLALAPRAVGLNAFATWDELFWTHASLRFWRALDQGSLARTYVIGQPGVVTMWLGTLVHTGRSALGGEAVYDTIRAAGRPRYSADDLTTLGPLAEQWEGLPLAIAATASLAVGVMYLLLRRLVGDRAALLGGLLLAFDPFFIAHSRVFALDAVLASLMTLGLLAWLIYRQGGGWRFLFLSGVLGGLAALQKTTGLFLWGFVGLLCGLSALRLWTRGQARVALARDGKAFAAWTMTAALTYVAVWPAMWAAPGQTLAALYCTLFAYAEVAYDPTFFLGQPTTAPGPLFYPVVALFRLPPLTWAGLALLAWRAVRGDKSIPWPVIGGLVGAGLWIGLGLSLPAAKFERYLLPALLPLTLAAGAGLAWLWDALARPSIDRLPSLFYGPAKAPALARTAIGGLAIALVAQTVVVLLSHPHYLAWYNPLMGGQAEALAVLPLGWGEGMQGAARYLAAQPDAASLRVATWGAVGLAPFFRGQVVLPQPGKPWHEADYSVVYITDVQRQDDVARAMRGRRPVHVTRVNGLDYAWVYRLSE